MSEVISVETILQQIVDRYRSLEKPDFHFLELETAAKPYKLLEIELERNFDIADCTDPNEDVCLAYQLIRLERVIAVLELSLVGRYACLHELVGWTQDDRSQIDRLMREFGVCMLDQRILGISIPLRLEYTAPEDVTLYQALFSDSLPSAG